MAFPKLIELLNYIDGDYHDETMYQKLRRVLGAAVRPTHYLAIPRGGGSLSTYHLGKVLINVA